MKRGKNTVFQVIDGEPYFAHKKEDYEICCDCALVHRVKYEVVNRRGELVKGTRVRMTVWRDDRSTAARRRPFKFTPEDHE